jgi:hypothetical protein
MSFLYRLLAWVLRPILKWVFKGSTLERKAQDEATADRNITESQQDGE